ncbi:D-alanyl-D-alanine carboxypeptidase (penicillin-binding protein 5/6) [Hydrogenispora ethanolica]|uniref:serine-type D-Ala-D-Ala carboxypeptidase n=1 Tax=Hydrogenispora ethanolica TaxID=1082276 RepID=A0A4R1RYL0_HYDET|nr:D-alanyl-D-alanine carboxypeptidase family protein [Hydrogenispora ethanolica]TCL71604.1 D-alanyl-D-alanine carboxypeptidase (penicillin-binding protein 5/6) [Hydrogenispora ethanolica]
MRVFFISRKLLWGFFLTLAGGGALAVIGLNPARPIMSDGYQIREQFPPLTYVPGYEQGPRVRAGAAIIIEAKTGAILFAKNAEQRRAPASTTKMMTAIVALEKGNLNRTVTISRRAAAVPGSSIPIRAGERVLLKELLKGMMLESGNNGSVAVAEGVAGGVDPFIELMNRKAKEIGALQTNFRNPHGLRAPSHYTTALDLALIARYGLANPKFAALVSRKTATLQKLGGKDEKLWNTNRLLWSFQGADGVKTGTTNEAGYCLVASATREGQRYIAVVLNSGDRWGDCARMLEYAFTEFTTVQIANTRKALARVSVAGGRPRQVLVYPRANLFAVVRKGQEGLVRAQLTLIPQPVRAPLHPGQALGKIGYRFQDQTVTGVDLVVRQPVRRRWWPW